METAAERLKKAGICLSEEAGKYTPPQNQKKHPPAGVPRIGQPKQQPTEPDGRKSPTGMQ